MGIKKKKLGCPVIFPHRWQELAKDKDRFSEAVREYRGQYPNVTAAEAGRKVSAFRRDTLQLK